MAVRGFPRPCLTRAVLVVLLLAGARIAHAEQVAYAYGDRDGTNDLVTMLNTATRGKLGSIPVGAGSPTLFGGGMAMSPDGPRVYVVNGADQTISVISTLTSSVIATIGSGPKPTTIVVSADGSRLYVGNGPENIGGPTAIRVISTSSGATLGTIQIATSPIVATFGIALSADGRRLYATGWTGSCERNAIKVIDTASHTYPRPRVSPGPSATGSCRPIPIGEGRSGRTGDGCRPGQPERARHRMVRPPGAAAIRSSVCDDCGDR